MFYDGDDQHCYPFPVFLSICFLCLFECYSMFLLITHLISLEYDVAMTYFFLAFVVKLWISLCALSVDALAILANFMIVLPFFTVPLVFSFHYGFQIFMCAYNSCTMCFGDFQICGVALVNSLSHASQVRNSLSQARKKKVS